MYEYFFVILCYSFYRLYAYVLLSLGCNREAIGLVTLLYNEVYQKLKNPVGVAEYMYSERPFLIALAAEDTIVSWK